MTLETVITEKLAAVCDVYPSVAPKGSPYPFIVYHIAFTDAVNCASGATGLRAHHCQIDVYSTNHAELRTLVQSVRDAFAGYMIEQEADMPASSERVRVLFRTRLQIAVPLQE